MNKDDKELLLKDLCARLPYGVKLRYIEDCVVKKISHTITMDTVWLEHIIYGDADIKPYLRPMSSMTEEEKIEWDAEYAYNINSYPYEQYLVEMTDWLNAHHFDYRGLIEKGLALEAPEGMYKTE